MPAKIDIVLRRERPEDYQAAETLTREAFWNRHVPGCCEHYLLHVMRAAQAFIPALDTVAEAGGLLVGHIAYTRAVVVDDDGKPQDVLSFGPLSVLPSHQGLGIGGALIEQTAKEARALGHRAILIYGDPLYYARFGFAPAESFGIATAGNLYMPPLQALELVPGALAGVTGRFIEDAVYDVDEQAALAFDRGFPPKALCGDLPSQRRFAQLIAMGTPRAGR